MAVGVDVLYADRTEENKAHVLISSLLQSELRDKVGHGCLAQKKNKEATSYVINRLAP